MARRWLVVGALSAVSLLAAQPSQAQRPSPRSIILTPQAILCYGIKLQPELRSAISPSQEIEQSIGYRVAQVAAGRLKARGFRAFNKFFPYRRLKIIPATVGAGGPCSEHNPKTVFLQVEIGLNSRGQPYQIRGTISQAGRSIDRTVDRRSRAEWPVGQFMGHFPDTRLYHAVFADLPPIVEGLISGIEVRPDAE